MTLNQLYVFVAAMVGHFVGDYLLQNQWMAIGKSFPGKRGHIACTVHVALYTLAIALFTWQWSPLFVAVVFIPHWVIDRNALAWYWIDFKNGFSHKDLWDKGPLCAARFEAGQPGFNMMEGERLDKVKQQRLENNVWKTAFAAPVYIVSDNTIHWVCLWFTVKFLIH